MSFTSDSALVLVAQRDVREGPAERFMNTQCASSRNVRRLCFARSHLKNHIGTQVDDVDRLEDVVRGGFCSVGRNGSGRA